MSLGTVLSRSVFVACLIGISYRKTVNDVYMLEMRLISGHTNFVIFDFSLEFYIVLWAFNKQEFLCQYSWTEGGMLDFCISRLQKQRVS